MCGVPRGDGEVSSDGADTKRLRVYDAVIADMLAKVAAGYTTGCMGTNAKDTAEFAKQVVKSLLQFQDA